MAAKAQQKLAIVKPESLLKNIIESQLYTLYDVFFIKNDAEFAQLADRCVLLANILHSQKQKTTQTQKLYISLIRKLMFIEFHTKFELPPILSEQYEHSVLTTMCAMKANKTPEVDYLINLLYNAYNTLLIKKELYNTFLKDNTIVHSLNMNIDDARNSISKTFDDITSSNNMYYKKFLMYLGKYKLDNDKEACKPLLKQFLTELDKNLNHLQYPSSTHPLDPSLAHPLAHHLSSAHPLAHHLSSAHSSAEASAHSSASASDNTNIHIKNKEGEWIKAQEFEIKAYKKFMENMQSMILHLKQNVVSAHIDINGQTVNFTVDPLKKGIYMNKIPIIDYNSIKINTNKTWRVAKPDEQLPAYLHFVYDVPEDLKYIYVNGDGIITKENGFVTFTLKDGKIYCDSGTRRGQEQMTHLLMAELPKKFSRMSANNNEFVGGTRKYIKHTRSTNHKQQTNSKSRKH